MNLKKFLKYIDDTVSEMSGEQITSFVHEIARTLPERQRNYFIETLKSFKSDGNAAGDNPGCSIDTLQLLRGEIAQVTEFLDAVNQGDFKLGSEIDYQYSNDWNWDNDEYEFIFSDPENILPKINKAIELLHRCIDLEAYKDGTELAGILFRLTVGVEGDYEDYEGTPLQIEDLFNEELLDGTYDNFVQDALYLIYNGNKLTDRPSCLYNFIQNLQYVDVKLEYIMQLGDGDLPEFDEFLPLWIEYLGIQDGPVADNLLAEALSMGSEDQYLEAARNFSDTHPELYKNILRNGMSEKDDTGMMQIGLEALVKIRKMSVLRGEIALLTADYANKLKDTEASERCWLEAFRSDPSVENYLRIRFLSRDYDRDAARVKTIYEEFYKKKDPDGSISSDLRYKKYCAILFFEKRFEETMRFGLCVQNSLGWTYTFMKEGLALFFILLFREKYIPSGIYAMYSNVLSWMNFSVEKFLNGTVFANDSEPEKKFWQLFEFWKSGVDFSAEDYDLWMSICENQLSRRVTGIMQASRTKYYDECAAFIAAYGEVLESNGAEHEKALIMEKYRAEYSRRRNFVAALRSYGMTR